MKITLIYSPLSRHFINIKSRQRLEAGEKFGDYWSFTWWEMGKEDLSASIKYILDISNKTQWVSGFILYLDIFSCKTWYHLKTANIGPWPRDDLLLCDAGPTSSAGREDLPGQRSLTNLLHHSHCGPPQGIVFISRVSPTLHHGTGGVGSSNPLGKCLDPSVFSKGPQVEKIPKKKQKRISLEVLTFFY